MKTLLILIAFALLVTNASIAQNHVDNIRFVHGGEELKPVGTLLISTKTESLPTDKETDSKFGQSVKTDKRTFNLIKQFIDTSQYLGKDNSYLKGTNEYFAIKYSNGLKFFLRGDKINQFFTDLRALLNSQQADKAVYDVLAYY